MTLIVEGVAGTDDSANRQRFKIENNIIIGEKLVLPDGPCNAGEWILNCMKSEPNFVAQIEALTGKQSTFEEMRVRSIKCAIWLKKQGIQRGDIVGLCADNHLDAYVPLLGCLYIGAICATWDHDLAISNTRHFLSMVTPKIAFVHAYSVNQLVEAAADLNMEVKPIVFENSLEMHESLDDIIDAQSMSEVEEFRCTKIDGLSDVAIIVNSSGTTGLPKATELSHKALRIVCLPRNDLHKRVSMWSPTLRWQFGIMETVKAICTYCQRIIAPDYDNAVEYAKFIEKYKVEVFATDPCIIKQFVKYNLTSKYNFESLKLLSVAGSLFHKELQDACMKLLPHVQTLQCYGSSDAGSCCTEQTENSSSGSCGFVLKGVQLKIEDLMTRELLGPNQKGEILVKTETMMNGYYKNPQATKRAFDSHGWLHTGDIGYYNENGEVFIVDRISEFIDYRTIKVLPAEIETTLLCHTAITDAAVVGVDHEIDGQHPLAIVCKLPDKELTEQEVIDFVSKHLPDYCRLRAGVKFIDKLPRTATGKIARKQLKEWVNMSRCTKSTSMQIEKLL